VESLQAQLTQAQSDAAEGTSALEAAQSLVETLKAELSEAQATADSKASEVDSLRTQLADAQGPAEGRAAEVSQLHAALQQSTAELNELELTLKQLKQDLQEAEGRAAAARDLQQALEQAQLENQQLASELQQAQATAQEQASEVQELNEMLQKQAQQLQEAQDALQQKGAQLQQARAEVERQGAELQALQQASRAAPAPPLTGPPAAEMSGAAAREAGPGVSNGAASTSSTAGGDASTGSTASVNAGTGSTAGGTSSTVPPQGSTPAAGVSPEHVALMRQITTSAALLAPFFRSVKASHTSLSTTAAQLAQLEAEVDNLLPVVSAINAKSSSSSPAAAAAATAATSRPQPPQPATLQQGVTATLVQQPAEQQGGPSYAQLALHPPSSPSHEMEDVPLDDALVLPMPPPPPQQQQQQQAPVPQIAASSRQVPAVGTGDGTAAQTGSTGHIYDQVSSTDELYWRRKVADLESLLSEVRQEADAAHAQIKGMVPLVSAQACKHMYHTSYSYMMCE
jgi:predicted  nucleic acid-binding Zn-ribbon protein